MTCLLAQSFIHKCRIMLQCFNSSHWYHHCIVWHELSFILLLGLPCLWVAFVQSFNFLLVLIGVRAFLLPLSFPSFCLLGVFGWGGVRLHSRGSLDQDLLWFLISAFDLLIGITFDLSIGFHFLQVISIFDPSIGIFSMVLNWILGGSSFATELFPRLVWPLMSFLDLSRTPSLLVSHCICTILHLVHFALDELLLYILSISLCYLWASALVGDYVAMCSICSWWYCHITMLS